MSSKTAAAVALVDAGQTVRQAARTVDVSEAAVYRAIKEKQAATTGCCPRCGGPVDTGGRTLAKNVPGFVRAGGETLAEVDTPSERLPTA
jgi:predicted transcriptional regulator